MSITVTLLDGLAVVDRETGKIFELVLGGQRSRVVFAALVLAAERPVLRRDLASAIWGDDLPSAWASALRTAVSGVRRAVWACQPLADSRLITLDDGTGWSCPTTSTSMCWSCSRWWTAHGPRWARIRPPR